MGSKSTFPFFDIEWASSVWQPIAQRRILRFNGRVWEGRREELIIKTLGRSYKFQQGQVRNKGSHTENIKIRTKLLATSLGGKVKGQTEGQKV